jgi:hypothetical protein
MISTLFIILFNKDKYFVGWHHRLNKDKKAGSGNKGLYTIAPLLMEEANLLPIQIQLVSEGTLKKLQRRHVRTTQRLLS